MIEERRDLGEHAALRLRAGDAVLRADVPYRDQPPPPGPVRIEIPPRALHPMPPEG